MSYNEKTLKTGWYTVINPNKLQNENKKLFYRSGLELKFMQMLDHGKSIIEWNYEKIIVKYKLPNEIYTNKTHNYIVDFWIKKIVNGAIKEFLIEIKPYEMLFPPKTPKRKTKKYYEKVENYIKNQSKFQYAKEYALNHGMEFQIITEKTLY